MFEKSEAFDNYISELLDEKLKILAKTDGNYAKIKAKIVFDSGMLKNELTNENFQLIEDFNGLLYDIAAIENRYLYFQGFGDCLRLLRQMNLFQPVAKIF